MSECSLMEHSRGPTDHSFPVSALHPTPRPQAGPPCTTKPSLRWLADVLDDDAGGGACAPAHTVFRANRFDRRTVAAPWQVCGDVHNASTYHHNCSPRVDANPAQELAEWGVVVAGNSYVDVAPEGVGYDRNDRSPLPVIPWPMLDESSPADFVKWSVNWDIGSWRSTVASVSRIGFMIIVSALALRCLCTVCRKSPSDFFMMLDL